MKTLRYATIVLVALFAFGCAAHRVEAPEKVKEPLLTIEQFQERWQVIVDTYIKPLPDTQEARLACFQKLITKGLEECLGDRQSHYLSKEKMSAMYEDIQGFYAGIGLELSDDMPVKIVSILEDSPAQRSGMFEVGDTIIEVDGKDVTREATVRVAGKIRGLAGTDITMRVKRGGNMLSPIPLVRARIVNHPVHAMDIDENITYIKIGQFNQQTPGELFDEMTKRLLVLLNDDVGIFNPRLKKFVIDLRGNPGGLVEVVGMMSYLFADSEDDIVITTMSRKGEEVNHAGQFVRDISLIPVGIFREVELSVLIDGGSASASEIFAEFLHQSMGVPLVGKKSYGKGSVQQIISFEEGDALYITIAEYVVGKNKTRINKIGIQPEYEVEGKAPVRKTSHDPLADPANDPQLRKAIELLRAKPRN